MANSATQNKIKKSEYQDYADCIRSDQVSAAGVMSSGWTRVTSPSLVKHSAASGIF